MQCVGKQKKNSKEESSEYDEKIIRFAAFELVVKLVKHHALSDLFICCMDLQPQQPSPIVADRHTP